MMVIVCVRRNSCEDDHQRNYYHHVDGRFAADGYAGTGAV